MLLICRFFTLIVLLSVFFISLRFPDYQDPIVQWWTTFVSIACHWLLADDTNLEPLYNKILFVPEALATLNDPLPKSIIAAFIARKNYIDSDVKADPRKILAQCDYASHLLADSLTYTSCKQKDNLVLVSRSFMF